MCNGMHDRISIGPNHIIYVDCSCRDSNDIITWNVNVPFTIITESSSPV